MFAAWLVLLLCVCVCVCVVCFSENEVSHWVTNLVVCDQPCLTTTPLYRSIPPVPSPNTLSAPPGQQPPPHIPQPLAATLWSQALPWRSEDFMNLLPRSSQGTSRSRLSLQENQLPKWLNKLCWNLRVKTALRRHAATQWTWTTQASQSVTCEAEACGAPPASPAPRFPFVRSLAKDDKGWYGSPCIYYTAS